MKPIGNFLLVASCTLAISLPAPAQTPDITGPPEPPPSLGKLVADTESISSWKVARVDRQKAILVFSKIADLKGGPAPRQVTMNLQRELRELPRLSQLLQWAEAGKQVVCFFSEQPPGSSVDFCVGNMWFRAYFEGQSIIRPYSCELLTLTYVGPVASLIGHVRDLLAGREVTVTMRAWGAETRPWLPIPWAGEYVDNGWGNDNFYGWEWLNQQWLYGRKGRVWRVKTRPKADDIVTFVACGMAGREAVPALMRALKDKDPRVRAEAAYDLAQVEGARAALPALSPLLADPDRHVQIIAAETLLRLEPVNKTALGILTSNLRHGDMTVRSEATVVLAALGTRSLDAVPAIVSALRNDEAPLVRKLAAEALSWIASDPTQPGYRPKPAVRALARAMQRDKSGDVRLAAVRSLIRFGPDAGQARKTLSAALRLARTSSKNRPRRNQKSEKEQEFDRQTALNAAVILARLGARGVPPLCAALKRKHCDIRKEILEQLGELGPVAKPALTVIKKILRKATLEPTELEEQLAAVDAFLQIDPQQAQLAVLPVLGWQMEEKLFWGAAAQKAAKLEGWVARLLVPDMVKLLKDRRQNKRDCQLLLNAIANLGPVAEDAVPEVILHLESTDWITRNCAASCLGQIGRPAKQALPKLTALALSDKDRYVRLGAAQAIVQIGGPNSVAFRILTDALTDPDYCDSALRHLASLGPTARPALPALRKIMHDRKSPMRCNAADAFWKMAERHESAPAQVGYHREPLETLIVDERLEAVDALIDVLVNGGDAENAITSLGSIGPPARKAMPLLVKAMDKEPTRLAALYSIFEMGERLDEAKLAALVNDKDENVRWRAAVALIKINRHHAKAIAIITEKVDQMPMMAMYLDLPGARKLIPCLTRALRSPNYYASAAGALYRIDPAAAARAGVYSVPLKACRHFELIFGRSLLD